MMSARTYLDYNATSPLRPEVLAAVTSALSRPGNPSSIHREGRSARALVERARAQVAALVGARAEDVIFTSGGTEANATALRSGAIIDAEGRAATRLVVGEGEHASVLAGHGFPDDAVEHVGVDGHGRIDLRRVEQVLDASSDELVLVSVQLANNETGVLQPVREIAELVRSRGGLLHSDAVQAPGRVSIDMTALGLDALTLSGHKLGAPTGVGALVLAPGRVGPNLPLIRGGGQENRHRGGTENLAGIVGFGVAAEIAAETLHTEAARLATLRDGAERELREIAPDAIIFGEVAARLPNTLAFAVPGLSAETALIALDLDGVAVSSGSACSSGKVASSHVLAAMGVPDDLARGAIRVSFGWNSTPDDVVRFVKAFARLLQRLYERGRAVAA